MFQKTFSLLTALFFLSATNAFSASCGTDQLLKAQGFTVHPTSEFTQYARMVMDMVKGNDNFKAGSDFVISSKEIDKAVRLQAFDDVRTVGDVMIDDVVVFSDVETNSLYEVRWFDGVNKHVVYENIKCANYPIPWAYNSMW